MVCNIEDAGFEIRDILTWLYGQGFPHGKDIAKEIDKIETGITRGKRGKTVSSNTSMEAPNYERTPKGEPISEEAKKWEGWNTGLKPAVEFITLARKPISEKNIALNVLKWGTGAMNIDACRIELDGEIVPINRLEEWSGFGEHIEPEYEATVNTKGRYPSNLILDSKAAALLDSENPKSKSSTAIRHNNGKHDAQSYGTYGSVDSTGYGDEGGVSRFFYVAKASKTEKNEGLDELEKKANSGSYQFRTDGSLDGKPTQPRANFHPSVKPVKLMEYLIKLITPKGGVCLDHYLGSGSTGVGAVHLGVDFIGIEKEEDYMLIAKTRINNSKLES
jgi:site-specific DNA-methyltransferase (adenine-specific)